MPCGVFRMCNSVSLSNLKGACAKDQNSQPGETADENSPEAAGESLSEPALQDHSIGSTTNVPVVQSELSNTNESSNNVDSTCEEITNGMSHIIADPICESEEVILDSMYVFFFFNLIHYTLNNIV